MGSRLDTAQQFVSTVAVAIANVSLYSANHPRVEQLCKSAMELYATLLGDHSALRLMSINQQLVLDELPLPSGLHQRRLLQSMLGCSVSHIELQRGLEERDLLPLISWLSAARVQHPPQCAHIRCGSVVVRQPGTGSSARLDGATLLASDHGSAFQDYSPQELERFMEIYATVKQQQHLNMVGLSDMVSSFIDTLHFHADSLMTLAPLREIDDYTFVHSTNVCLLNIAQARSLGVEGVQLHDIGIAALLHDVGKQFIPTEILTKPGKLDDDEWKMMQKHPQLGALYLLDNPGVPRLAVVTAFEHHMRYDRLGYPCPPASWIQNISSQMTAISDVFDALRTSRSYRKALEPDKIKEIFAQMSGEDLHPGLTANFLSMFVPPPLKRS